MSLTPECTMRLVSVNGPGAPATNSSWNVFVLNNGPARKLQTYDVPSGAHAGSTRTTGRDGSIRTLTSWPAARSFT